VRLGKADEESFARGTGIDAEWVLDYTTFLVYGFVRENELKNA
jgi:hypothetical protein